MLSTEKTNKILAVLTIIFTLSIPAALVGAFYGMNITLPWGIETGSWNFFGLYATSIILFQFQ
jgi:magnesium transporter